MKNFYNEILEKSETAIKELGGVQQREVVL